MQKHITTKRHLSQTEKENSASEPEHIDSQWEEYSSFHDSFTELLSYENSRRSTSDFWQLNYI